MTCMIEVLNTNDRHLHNMLKVLKHITAVLSKATFNDLQALKIRINSQLLTRAFVTFTKVLTKYNGF